MGRGNGNCEQRIEAEHRRRRAHELRARRFTNRAIAAELGISEASVRRYGLERLPPPEPELTPKPLPEEYRYHYEERVIEGQRVKVCVFSDRPTDPHVLRRRCRKSEQFIESTRRGGRATRARRQPS